MMNYESLQDTHDQDEENVMVHTAEFPQSRWNLIEDLDSFFSRMYQYHQKHGFFCMLLEEVLELIQFIFIAVLTMYIFHGVNYDVLFKNVPPPTNATKVTLFDVLSTPGECFNDFGGWSWIILLIVAIVWIFKLIKGVYQMFYYWDIKQFYNTALKIEDKELDNLTWHEVQSRVKVVQQEQQMCIHKPELTELDIYHRILRQQNYLVAMVNKKILPPRFRVPFLGETVFWTPSMRYNMQLLFFWSPWSPFEHPWQLKEDFKKFHLRQELAKQFGRKVLWLAFANLIFAFIILIWQMLYAFFSYAAIIRREPSILAKRRWSLYGRLYLRHFNELEHELQARLTRAYRPATKYVAAFNSPMATVISENVAFYATAILAVFVVLSVYDEDVLTVEHSLTIMTLLTVLVAVFKNLAPDETTPWDPEKLLENVVLHTHYLPEGWSGQAHTTRIRKEFEQLFQYSFVGLLETVLSPIVTPFVLYYYIYPRSLEFVDFFRSFTVTVGGVGDVCSFAQMDVRKHGNPDWHDSDEPNRNVQVNVADQEQLTQGEDGKTELSLIHFTCTNPSWKPPENAHNFVKFVQNQSNLTVSQSTGDFMLRRNLDDSLNTTRTDAPLQSTLNECFNSNYDRNEAPVHASGMWRTEGPSLTGARVMAASAVYIHNLHHMKTGQRGNRNAQETTPLLFPH